MTDLYLAPGNRPAAPAHPPMADSVCGSVAFAPASVEDDARPPSSAVGALIAGVISGYATAGLCLVSGGSLPLSLLVLAASGSAATLGLSLIGAYGTRSPGGRQVRGPAARKGVTPRADARLAFSLR